MQDQSDQDDDSTRPPTNVEEHPPALNDQDEQRKLPRDHRLYSPTERAGLKWLAVRDGTAVTAKRYGIPSRTLEQWVAADGGITAIRGWLEEITLADYLRAERSIYEAVVARAGSLSVDDLLLTFRKLVESRTGAAVIANAQPVAAAQATVTLKVVEKDGEVTVIDLGTPPEAEG